MRNSDHEELMAITYTEEDGSFRIHAYGKRKPGDDDNLEFDWVLTV